MWVKVCRMDFEGFEIDGNDLMVTQLVNWIKAGGGGDRLCADHRAQMLAAAQLAELVVKVFMLPRSDASADLFKALMSDCAEDVELSRRVITALAGSMARLELTLEAARAAHDELAKSDPEIVAAISDAVDRKWPV